MNVLLFVIFAIDLIVTAQVTKSWDANVKEHSATREADRFLDRRWIKIVEDGLVFCSDKSSTVNATGDSPLCPNENDNSYSEERLYQEPYVPMYNKADLAVCLDRIATQRAELNQRLPQAQRRPNHFAFVGDSTVRRHFLGFLQVFTAPVSYFYPNRMNQNRCILLDDSRQRSESTHAIHEIRRVLLPRRSKHDQQVIRRFDGIFPMAPAGS